MASDEDQRVLDDLCDANGLSRVQVGTRMSSVMQIEMFMLNFPQMRCLHMFPMLRMLNISQQDVRKIEGLEVCVNLEKLWLHENRIECIECLESLECLEELYLYSNQISKIAGLQRNTSLQILWLADNHIQRLENLSHLSRLRELNVAANFLESIGDSLVHNTRLEILNIAANPIGSFKELAHASGIHSLTHVAFDDPHWGSCPLSALHNYQTLALYTMPQISKLDMCALHEDTKQAAEAEFLKRKMYYNMRIKTLKRSVARYMASARKGRDRWLKRINCELATITKALKTIEREIEEALHGFSKNSSCNDVSWQQQLHAKRSKLQDARRHTIANAVGAERSFAQQREDALYRCDIKTRWFMAELESGGNLQMVEHAPNDSYFQSAESRLESNLDCYGAVAKEFGITGVTVQRVVEVFNRHLIIRFNDALDEVHESEPERDFGEGEYLMLGSETVKSMSLERVAEEGVPIDKDGQLWLSNRLSTADFPRLKKATEGTNSSCGLMEGRVMIVRVIRGRHVEASKSELQRSSDLLNGSLNNTLHSIVYRPDSFDTFNMQLHPFNSSLVLPECVIEFVYDTITGTSNRSMASSPSVQELDCDTKPIMRPLAFFLDQEHKEVPENTDDSVPVHKCEQVTREALQMHPEATERPTLYVMTIEEISRVTCDFRLRELTYLNLHNNSIRKIEALDELQDLQTLVLSFNKISKIEGLKSLKRLETLDLSFNFIERIDGLKGLSMLQNLDLCSNSLHRLEDINMLKKYTPNLRVLNLRNNPLRDNSSYKGVVLRRLVSLEVLDDCNVSKSEIENASEASSMLSLELVKRHARLTTPKLWSISTECEQPHQVQSSASMSEPDPSMSNEYSDDNNWLERCEHLEVKHQHLRLLQNLNRLPNLKCASFNDNELNKTDGLEQNKRLESLSLENNTITSLEGIRNLIRLRKLDLGSNCISNIDALSKLTQLTQLSIENNYIESLSGLNSLTALMELYASNNRVGDLREIKNLKPLNKLMILDLDKNSISTSPEYRTYIVFTLNKLKVLDGESITPAEQIRASNMYSGKLTRELLEDCTGTYDLTGLTSIDLSSQRIKELGNVLHSPAEMSEVRELNLDDNLLINANGVQYLPSLKVLRLNHNRIENQPLLPNSRTDKGSLREIDATEHTEAEPNGSLLAPSQSLEVVQLGGNNISSIASLQLYRCCNLRALFLHENDICRLDGLDGLPKLEELVLDKNRVKHLEALSLTGVCYTIRELRLDDNGLRSLANIELLEQLESLSIASNRITELSELERLSNLHSLVELNAYCSPLSRKPNYRTVALAYCPSLKVIDNDKVTEDERDNAERAAEYMAQQNAEQQGSVNSSTPGLVQTASSIPSASASAAAASGSGGAAHAQHSGAVHQQQSSAKVPVRLTHVSFDHLLHINNVAGAAVYNGTTGSNGQYTAAGEGNMPGRSSSGHISRF